MKSELIHSRVLIRLIVLLPSRLDSTTSSHWSKGEAEIESGVGAKALSFEF